MLVPAVLLMWTKMIGTGCCFSSCNRRCFLLLAFFIVHDSLEQADILQKTSSALTLLRHVEVFRAYDSSTVINADQQRGMSRSVVQKVRPDMSTVVVYVARAWIL